jgi:hypothetical protein
MNAQERLTPSAQPGERQRDRRGWRQMQEFLPRRPQSRRARDQQNSGEKHSDPRPIPRAPAERGQDQEIDRRVFQEIDTVGEERDRADRQRHREFHPEIAKVECGNQPDCLPQASRHVALPRLFGY